MVVKLEKNEFYVSDDGMLCLWGIGEMWVELVDLVFKVIGYWGIFFDGVLFYECWGIIFNEDGCVVEMDINELVF